MFLGLDEMTSGLVNASFSLPEWQAVKMIFFAPWQVLYNLSQKPSKILAILELGKQSFNQVQHRWWVNLSAVLQKEKNVANV